MHVLMAIGRRRTKAMITDVQIEFEVLEEIVKFKDEGGFGKRRF